MPRQQPTSLLPTIIPSVAIMNQRFNERMKSYLDQTTNNERSSRENTPEAPKESHTVSRKRKQCHSAIPEAREEQDEDKDEDEEKEEAEGEEEKADPPQQESQKLVLKINLRDNSILIVNTAPSSQTTYEPCSEPKAHKRRRHRNHQQHHHHQEGAKEERKRNHHRRPAPTQSNPPPPPPTTITKQSPTRSRPSPSPPTYPFLRIENEPKEPWDPIPLPSPSLPGDTEGAKAAWARLFPHLEPLGEYGGSPTGWMKRMCWKGGVWKERGPEEEYVERVLGRVGGAEKGMMGVDGEGRYWRG